LNRYIQKFWDNELGFAKGCTVIELMAESYRAQLFALDIVGEPIRVRGEERSNLRELTGAGQIEIPSSLEEINDAGFGNCLSLNRAFFASDSQLKTLSGFLHCVSLNEIEIPSAVTSVGDDAYFNHFSTQQSRQDY
jgi:hypothetical protein